MNRPRVSIARMLAVIAVLGLDFSLVRLFMATEDGLQGLLVYGLATSTGLIGALVGAGRFRRFCLGFTTSAVAAAVVFLVLCGLSARVGEAYGGAYLNGVLRRAPFFLSDSFRWVYHPETEDFVEAPGLLLLLTVEAILALPLLAVAFVGGLLTLAVGRPSRPDSTPVPTLK